MPKRLRHCLSWLYLRVRASISRPNKIFIQHCRVAVECNGIMLAEFIRIKMQTVLDIEAKIVELIRNMKLRYSTSFQSLLQKVNELSRRFNDFRNNAKVIDIDRPWNGVFIEKPHSLRQIQIRREPS